MRVNVRNNLAGVPGLCRHCSYGVVRAFENGDVTQFCLSVKEPVRQTVTLCTYFEQRGNAPFDMRAKGWILEINVKDDTIGFVRPGTEKHKKIRHETQFPDEG